MFHFRCDSCDFNRDIDYLPRDYVYDADRQMPMLQRHIWCSQCNTVSVAEAFRKDSEWRARRTRPPFCLKCGNENIIVPEKDWADLHHPTCGGTLVCTATIIGGTFIDPEPHKYTIDGKLIEIGYRQDQHEGSQQVALELWWPNDQ